MISALLLLGLVKSSAAKVDLNVNIIDPKPGWPGSGKGPVLTPYVDLDGNVLTFDTGHDDYTLCLLDEDGQLVYSAFVPSAMTTAILPSWFSGDYEIQLLTGGNYYFFGTISL